MKEVKFTIQEVTYSELVFGANIDRLLPAYKDIPAEFKRIGATKWEQVANRWFTNGLRRVEFKPKSTTDQVKALRHLSTIMQSYEPSHEHKIAAVAYLMSLWFEDVVISE